MHCWILMTSASVQHTTDIGKLLAGGRRCQNIKDNAWFLSDCFRPQLPANTSTSMSGGLTVNYKQASGKKMNQRKRPRAEHAV